MRRAWYRISRLRDKWLRGLRKGMLRGLFRWFDPDLRAILRAAQEFCEDEMRRELAEAHRTRHKLTPREAYSKAEREAMMLAETEKSRQAMREQIRRVI